MKYFLDTNVCIHYLNNTSAGIGRRVTTLGRKQIFVPSVVLEELFFGAYRSARVTENISRIRLFAATFNIWPFDSQAAHESARIRAHLASGGNTIGPFDNLIAGTALAGDGILVTHNIREFQRVPGLRVEDWQT